MKGNRTKENRETRHLQENNARYKNEIDTYKMYAEARRANRKFKQEDVKMFYDRIVNYISDCTEKEEPFTVAGLILAMGVSKDTYYRMKSGEYDYRLDEYMEINGIAEEDVLIDNSGIEYVVNEAGEVVLLIEYRELIQKAQLMIEEQTEKRLYKSGRAGDIFALKALHGWEDTPQHQTVNQTLVIATEEQAREAIRLLG